MSKRRRSEPTAADQDTALTQPLIDVSPPLSPLRVVYGSVIPCAQPSAAFSEDEASASSDESACSDLSSELDTEPEEV